MTSRYRRLKNQALLGCMALAVVLVLVPLISLLVTLFDHGARVINWHFLTGAWAPVGEQGGIAHAIAGSVALLLLASLIAVPIGLVQGVYLSQFGSTRLARWTRILLDVMTGIPAIIVGVFVYTVMVPKHGFSLGVGYSMLAGGLALAMVMLPIFARAAEEALRAIPRHVNEAGLALGLPRRVVIRRILLRAALPSLLTALFLALARIGGEAAPLLFTAFGSNEWPNSLVRPVGSLPQLLFDYARQPFQELVDQAWGAALVLVVLILTIRLATNLYLRWYFRPGGDI